MVSSGHGSQSLTLRLFAALSHISSSLLLLQQTVQPPPVPAFDPRLWSSLRPATRTAYQLALQTFKTWAQEQRIPEPTS